MNQCRLVKKMGTLTTLINTDLHGFYCAQAIAFL